jgi:hypothetical protein
VARGRPRRPASGGRTEAPAGVAGSESTEREIHLGRVVAGRPGTLRPTANPSFSHERSQSVPVAYRASKSRSKRHSIFSGGRILTFQAAKLV